MALIKDIYSEIVTLSDINHAQFHLNLRGRRGCNHMVVGFTNLQLPMQSVPITTDVVSSNLDQGEVYSIM